MRSCASRRRMNKRRAGSAIGLTSRSCRNNRPRLLLRDSEPRQPAMFVITKITEQRRDPNRRNIFLNGAFAFGCNLNVVAKFRLRPGLKLDEQQLREIEFGEVKQ